MCPCCEHSGFIHYSYDEAEVVRDRFIVHVQYNAASYLVVAPRGEKFGENMFVVVSCHFADKG